MIHITTIGYFFLVVFGAFIGLLGSVMGVGGGVFIVPLLVLVFNIPIQNAIAVSLISIIATSSAVASVNVEKGLANVRLGIVMELTMAAGSIAGALLMSHLPTKIVSLAFSIFLFPVSASMYLKSRKKIVVSNFKQERTSPIGGTFFDPASGQNISYKAERMPLAILFSFFAGALSGLLGLGGGVVQVPVMNILCKIPIKAAAATSNFMIGVSAAASALIFYKKGYVISDISFYVSLGTLFGSFLGMKFLYKAKSEKIQTLFSVLIFIVAIRMIFKSL